MLAGPRPVSGRDGFTLLEILIAMFILTIVVSLVFGSFSAIFSSADRINLSSDTQEMGIACLDRIGRDLKALYITQAPRYKPPQLDSPLDLHRFVAEEQSEGGETFTQLRFTSLAHISLNQDPIEGVAEIVYYVQSVQGLGFVLRRSDKLYPYPEKFEPSATDPILCENIRAFELLFFDEKEHENKKWNSESDDYSYGTPRGVRVKLIIGSETQTLTLTTELALPTYRYQPVKK
jgi:general secretion pathway protein J